MGSDISFPILCASSFYSLVCARGKLEEACSIVDEGKFLSWCQNFSGGGFNGDDQVCWGDRSVVDRWLKAVKSINGCPEPSKSPVNREYLTINSRLFKMVGEEVKAVQTVHPGKLYSVLRGSVAAPDRHWLDLINCPAPWRAALGVDMALRPSVPIQMGGTGLKRETNPTPELFEILRWCELSKPQLESEKFEVYIGKKKENAEVSKQLGWYTISRDHWKSYCTERFGSPKGLYWTTQSSSKCSDVELVDRCITDARLETTRHRLWSLYNLYWDAAESGCVVLHNPSIPWHIPLRKIDINVSEFPLDNPYLSGPAPCEPSVDYGPSFWKKNALLGKVGNFRTKKKNFATCSKDRNNVAVAAFNTASPKLLTFTGEITDDLHLDQRWLRHDFRGLAPE